MRPLGCFVIILLVLSACNRQQPPGASLPSEIEQASLRLCSALEHGRADSLAAMVTDDFVLMIPGADDIRGRAAFKQAAVRMLAATQISGIQVVKREINEGDSAAYELATYSGTLSTKGKEPHPIRGRYLMIWQRQGDGTWFVRRSLFNANSPAQ